MEAVFQAAIQRQKSLLLTDDSTAQTWKYEYSGQGSHFRWGKDNQIYHWQEFQQHYKHEADAEWSFAAKVMNSDGSFHLPASFIEHIEGDL